LFQVHEEAVASLETPTTRRIVTFTLYPVKHDFPEIFPIRFTVKTSCSHAKRRPRRASARTIDSLYRLSV
jgi:hypothetical protein